MDEKVIESREYLMKLYKGVYTATSGVGRQALARIDDTLANLRIRNNNLQEQLDKYKEVIEEVREYIDNNTEFEHDGDDYGYTEWVNIKPQNIVFINELLQILDKIKENK